MVEIVGALFNKMFPCRCFLTVLCNKILNTLNYL